LPGELVQRKPDHSTPPARYYAEKIFIKDAIIRTYHWSFAMKNLLCLQGALNSVFGEEIGCEHKEFSSEFDCSDLFKKP
jgi:hypothetical protein